MVLLQPRLNLKVSQKQILTPGLVQMVSVLALNKLELKDMINAEIVENPVLDEYLESVPTLDEVGGREEQRERESTPPTEEQKEQKKNDEKDPFDEIDFGSFFQEYLDPGYRSFADLETIERPSFENFLSKPTSLTDHLLWQLGSMHLKDDVLAAAELVIGNLNEDGYLLASDDELLAVADPSVSGDADGGNGLAKGAIEVLRTLAAEAAASQTGDTLQAEHAAERPKLLNKPEIPSRALFGRDALREAIDLVRQFDPVGVASRDLRECLSAQLVDLRNQYDYRGTDEHEDEALRDAVTIVDKYLHQLQNKQYKEIAKAIGTSVEARNAGVRAHPHARSQAWSPLQQDRGSAD